MACIAARCSASCPSTPPGFECGLHSTHAGHRRLMERVFERIATITPRERPCRSKDSLFAPKSPRLKLRLAAVCSLRRQGESWSRTWLPRLWDQRSQSGNPLRPAETAPLPGRRRDHLAVLTIDGLLQWNRYQAGLRSNHPHIAHRSSRCRPIPVTLVDHRFRDAPCRVAR